MTVVLMYPRIKKQVLSSWPPRGLVLLATVLKKYLDESIEIIDTSFEKDMDYAKRNLNRIKPKVFSVSVTPDFVDNAKKMIAHAKKLGSKVIIGGPYATIEPEKIFSDISGIDYIITGDMWDYYQALKSVLEDENSSDNILDLKGIYYKKGKEILFTGEPSHDEDINTLPFPDYGLLPTARDYFEFGTVTMMTSLGCPYNCSFCQPVLNRLFGKKIRFRSPSNVVEEIKTLRNNYDINEFYFIDDTFPLDLSWLEEFVSLLQENKLQDLRFIINTRANLVMEKAASLFKKMNCSLINIGVESGSDKILKNLNKKITRKQIIEAFDNCKKYGLKTNANFVMGNPGETKKTLKETEKLIEQIKPEFLYMSFLTPYPGTRLYEEAEKAGTLNLYGNKEFNCRTYNKEELPLKNNNLIYQELIAFRKRVFRKRKPLLLWYFLKLILKDLFRALKKGKILSYIKTQRRRIKIYWKTKDYFG